MSAEDPKIAPNGLPFESVWDYPRPPAIEPVPHRLRIIFNGKVLADTTSAWRILETSHPPTYYIPPKDIQMQYLKPNARETYCEWKGECHYYDVEVDGKKVVAPAWFYPKPSSRYAALKDHVAFYASKMDECYVGDEKVAPQQGDFYGGWVTANISGGKRGMKGGPGTWGW